MPDQTSPMTSPTLEWRGAFTNAELNLLHAEGFGHDIVDDDWWGRVNKHSLGWVCMRHSGKLTGFANIAWDGGDHAFLLDTLVAAEFRHRGLATAIVQEAARQAQAAGCEWLHVDFEPHLGDFYLRHCGFRQTDAGLIALR
jgi:GNAT superfamily N-acetyltransferase